MIDTHVLPCMVSIRYTIMPVPLFKSINVRLVAFLTVVTTEYAALKGIANNIVYTIIYEVARSFRRND